MTGTEVYRIKKGILKSKILSIPIDFGIVYSINGKISTDLYVNETFIFDNLMENDINFETIFVLDCLTEYNDELKIDLLSIRNINPSLSKIVSESDGKMQRLKKKLVWEFIRKWRFLTLFGIGRFTNRIYGFHRKQ